MTQVWTKTDNNSFRKSEGERPITPSNYESYTLDFTAFQDIISEATDRFDSQEGVLIHWPMPNDKMSKFRIKRSDVFHPDLAAKYPEISAYTGYSLTDPTAVLKISVSHKGIEGMLLSNRHETIYLDRYQPKSKNKYILYKRSDYNRAMDSREFTCTVDYPEGYKPQEIDHTIRFGDCQLRKYRLALACTGEYAQFHGGNVPDVLAEYNASMVRVNGIFERDLSITMELIPDTDELIFLNEDFDPYTNDEGGTMLDENQAAIDQIIGFENYDIGHVYSTGGGGVASPRSPCTNRKAKGVTGLSNPTGDFFWVDYVSHEMGHQYGGGHTQNNECNRYGPAAMEPGSASTIMGYAGICDPNVQSNSDDYFHAISQTEIANFIVAGNGNNCAEIITLDNSAPEIVTTTPTGQILPSQTPFFLTATATDEDNDVLTYCWEQMNNELAEMPPVATATGGPAFRSYDPTENPTRYFPELSPVLFGVNSTTWEVLPNADRDMKFNLTVRDNKLLGGCTDDEEITISFVSTAGPFLITSQNTATTWNAGETVSITWDVANTDVAPISCENVDILFSFDRAESFPISLAENVPNDGEHEITVPTELTNQGRIMLTCSTASFFDINNRDIQVKAQFAAEVAPEFVTTCPSQNAVYIIDYTALASTPTTSTFTIDGLPDGASFTFSPEEVTDDEEVTLTISDLTSDMIGTYEIEIGIQGETITQIKNVTLNIAPDENTAVQISSPLEGSNGVSTTPLLTWETMDGIFMYEIEVSDKPNFESIVFEGQVNDLSIAPGELDLQTIYYWRVRGISPCLDAEWINFQSFQTIGSSCETVTEEANIPIAIDIENEITSELDFSSTNPFSTFRVSMNVEHTWVGDLSASLRSPSGSERILFDQPGTSSSLNGCDGDDLSVTFASDAIQTSEQFENMCNETSPSISGTFQPLQAFSTFEDESFNGTWQLMILDQAGGNGGQLVDWSISKCEYIPIAPGLILQNNELTLNGSIQEMITTTHLSMETIDPSNTRFIVRSIPLSGVLEKWNTTNSTFEEIAVGDEFTQQDINMNNVQYKLLDYSAATDQFLFDTQDDQFRYTSNNSFNISIELSALTLSADVTEQISCFGEEDGRIEVTVFGGVPGYTYSINEGPFTSSEVFENLGPGFYTIEVRDAINNTLISPLLEIIEPETITAEHTLGFNEISIEAEGGTGNFMYSLDGSNYGQSNVIEIFDGTTYRIYVKDENDCIYASEEFVYYQIYEVESSKTDVFCKGDSNGRISINSVSGGLSPYLYQLNEQSPTENTVFDNLPPDTYTIKVTGSGGSSFTLPDFVIIEPELELTMTSEVVDHTIVLTGIGGTPSYLYSINGSSFVNTNVFGPLPDGEYVGYVLDSFGCEVSETSIIVNTSISNIFLDQLSIYPNPTQHYFSIAGSGTKEIAYGILDINGKLLQKGILLENQAISVEDLPAGLYTISLEHKGQFKVFKLSKI